MKKNQHLITIRGSKGKGGGGSTFEADDNMFARQSAAFIDAISEGPIKGLVYGDASILVDEVRLRNVNQTTGLVSSTTNFNNFTVITKNGTAEQVVDADFFAEYPSAATTKDISSAELLENEPQYFTISSGTFEKRETDYVKITVSTTGMSAITKKGDNKGDINETSVYFTIDFNWVDNSGVHHTREMFDTGFQGKVSGKYAHTFGFNIEEIKRTSTINDWSVKVTKLSSSPDSSDSIEIQNAIYVDSMEAAIADKLEYPYTAYIGGVIDAEAFNSVPARGYEIDGKLIQIPTNHYPCDYNGRKLVCSDASSFAVGDLISQVGSISSLTATGTAEEGYTATATLSAAHGVASGETFRIRIATTVTQDEDFYEGLFVATATTSTAFTYTLNKPFDETLNSGAGGYKSLTSTTCGGTKTAEFFSGGLVDKKVGNTLYLRNVSAQDSAISGAITNGDGDSTNVTSATQVFIPANYRRVKATEKPGTAEQDWDGTYYQSWCNNPAWVYNDLITNKIYGLGNYIDQSQVNKWEIFQIGRYCDELVPAGVAAADLLSLHCTDDTNYIPSGSSGMHEPRFSANLVLQGKAEAFKVLSDVTSIFRGMAYWLNGQSYLVQDSEKDPVYQFTNGNVLNGEFKYEGTANKTRTNSVLVEWNNPQDYYRARTEVVELEETLQKETEFIKPESTRAFGCTSRGQARRLGKWKLLTNNWNTNTVTFETSLNAAFLRPGDIIQVIDQHKEGKSWGGRVSTSSSTTVINIDRKPTGFGNTSCESGYAVGDYRLTCSFVNYKAILAQDQATIGGTAYVRGAHLTSITTEEAASTLQDDSGDLVFVQWTPFTYTDTQFVSAVSNNGKTLTVASAFATAPANDAIWVLSRSALATGKTKQEAKLFRTISMLEKERNVYEITALEYNASKFDAVDKDEAFTQYRTIYLPDSFKPVPAVTNIDVEPKIKASGSGGTINSLVVDWDPATNSDGTLYTSVRHYEVEYSKDNERWFRAGTNTNTEYEIMDNADVAILSGTYYFKVYTVSLNGVRSPVAESGAEVIDFNRAVGPAEGSVGTDTHFINFIGNISGDFTLESGKVTFSPTNIFHNDGKNEHAVNSQAQLDFTGLSHTSTTGGDEGYVFFDHSASQFKAIAFDETSGQFYPVGSAVFATATGTLTTSLTSQPKKWTGLDSTNFDGELALGNVFKYTKGSNTRYHRVKKLESDSVMRTFNPTRDTIANSDNQAFSKPNFLVDYQNDTIMGKVTKTGASTYTLQKFGSSQGESAYEVHASNENFTFDANLDGTVTNESAYACDFTIKRGTQAYTFANSGTTQNTFGISLQARTGFDNDSDVVIDSSTGQVTIGDTDMDAHTSATATMRLFDRGRANLLIADKILSFTKSAQGTAGEDAKVVVVTPSAHMFFELFFAEGEEGLSGSGGKATEIHPTQITIRAATTNTTADGQWTTSAGTLTSIDNSHADPSCVVTSGNAVDGMTVTYTLHSDDGSASDSTTLEIVESFGNNITPLLTNEAHVYPASKTGVVSDITGSGTDIKVFEGSTLLDFTTSTATRGKYNIAISGNGNLTSTGAISSQGSSPVRFARVADHTPATGTDLYSIVYTITGKTSLNKSFSFSKLQTLTKSKTGSDGAEGQSAKTVELYKLNDSTFGTTTAGTFANPTNGVESGWSTTQPTISSNSDKIYMVRRTFTSDGESPQDAAWSSPVIVGQREDGSAGKQVQEIELYYPVSSGWTAGSFTSFPSSAPSTGTYNFSTGVVASIPTGWTQTKPASGVATVVSISRALATEATAGGGVSGSLTWSTPSLTDQGFQDTNFIFINSNGSPGTPSATAYPDLPTGWSDSPPAAESGKQLWSSKGVATLTSSGSYNFKFNYTWETPVIHVQNKADISLSQVEDKSSSTIRGEIVEADIVGSGNAFSVKPNKTTFADGSTEGAFNFSLDDGTATGVNVFTSAERTKLDRLRAGQNPANASQSILNNDIAINTSGQLTGIGTGVNTTISNAKIASGDLAGSGKVFSTLPASGATVGATWGSNISSQPADNDILNSGEFTGSLKNGGTTRTMSQMIDGRDRAVTGLDSSGRATVLNPTNFPMASVISAANAAAIKTSLGYFTLDNEIDITGLSNYSDANYLNSTVTNALVWGSIVITEGSTAAQFSSLDNGTSFNSYNTTGEMSITHPTLGTFGANYTWTKGTGTDAGKITAFALSNTGSGNDAWSSSSFGSADESKSITVTHTASGNTIVMAASVSIVNLGSGGSTGGGGGGGCFLPETLVDLPGGGKEEIQNIKIGDYVRTEHDHDQVDGVAQVTNIGSITVDSYYLLNQELGLTAGHPIWVEDKGWACIDPGDYYKECKQLNHVIDLEPVELEIGDKTTNGEVEILNKIDEQQEVWWITVDNTHTYYVNGKLVHNGSKQ